MHISLYQLYPIRFRHQSQLAQAKPKGIAESTRRANDAGKDDDDDEGEGAMHKISLRHLFAVLLAILHELLIFLISMRAGQQGTTKSLTIHRVLTCWQLVTQWFHSRIPTRMPTPHFLACGAVCVCVPVPCGDFCRSLPFLCVYFAGAHLTRHPLFTETRPGRT